MGEEQIQPKRKWHDMGVVKLIAILIILTLAGTMAYNFYKNYTLDKEAKIYQKGLQEGYLTATLQTVQTALERGNVQITYPVNQSGNISTQQLLLVTTIQCAELCKQVPQ